MICKQCKFFKWVYQQDAVVVDDINKTAGFCLRYPPVIIPAVEWTDGMDRDEYLALSSAWPIIDSTEWCGEFKSNKTMDS